MPHGLDAVEAHTRAPHIDAAAPTKSSQNTNAGDKAKDAKSFGLSWQLIVDGSGFSDEDKGPLRRAGAALGI